MSKAPRLSHSPRVRILFDCPKHDVELVIYEHLKAGLLDLLRGHVERFEATKAKVLMGRRVAWRWEEKR